MDHNFYPDTIARLMSVPGVADLERNRLQRVADKDGALRDLAYREIEESENRSDAEAVFFFESLDAARGALSLALGLGLVEGEVTFDNTVDPKWGVGQFAVRVQPQVVYAKPAIYQALVDGIAEMLDDDYELKGSPVEEDEDMWDLEERTFHVGAQRKGNIPPGGFTGKHKGSEKGSASDGAEVAAKLKHKKKGTYTGTPSSKSNPCGRLARKAGTARDKYGRRCSDGVQPDWAKSESLADLGAKLLDF